MLPPIKMHFNVLNRFFMLLVFVYLYFWVRLEEILPTNVQATAETKEFLLKVIDVLLDYVRTQNDRNEPILEFHHPEEMKRLLDLDLPETALPLQQLIQDCASTMKYQVRTGEYHFFSIRWRKIVEFSVTVKSQRIWTRALALLVIIVNKFLILRLSFSRSC